MPTTENREPVYTLEDIAYGVFDSDDSDLAKHILRLESRVDRLSDRLEALIDALAGQGIRTDDR